MAEKIVSPGVFTREKDLSFLPQGVVGFLHFLLYSIGVRIWSVSALMPVKEMVEIASVSL